MKNALIALLVLFAFAVSVPNVFACGLHKNKAAKTAANTEIG